MVTNIAYTESYLDRRQRLEAVFAPAHLTDEPETVLRLDDNYTLRGRLYSGETDGQRLDNACETELLDKDGNVLYSWRCLDADGVRPCGFLGFWWSQDGKSYLLFRRELYGYSVLEIETGRDFHYVPSCAYPENGEVPDETFIWCSAYYGAGNDMLAVAGCYWGCPYTTIVLDFMDPLAEHPAEEWLLIDDYFSPEKYDYDSLVPDAWEYHGDLILERWCAGTMSRPELIRIPSKKLRTAVDRLK